jgi:hypothetical protein
VRFRLNGAPYKRSLKTTDEKEAHAVVARVSETIRLIERGRLEMPADADPVVFVMSDGKLTSKVVAPKIRTLGALFDAYRANLPVGTKEDSTLEAENRHMKHLKRHLRTNCVGMAIFCKPFTNAKVRHFDQDELDEAKAWVWADLPYVAVKGAAHQSSVTQDVVQQASEESFPASDAPAY